MSKGKITVHNKISPNYRELHVDGGFGGITPRGFISISFYAERFPIPKSSEIEITDDDRLGKALATSEDSKQGIIREFEFGIYMDLNAAKSLAQFIATKVTELETLQQKKNGKATKK